MEGSPHSGCIFLKIADEAKITGVNGAGENQDYCQIVLIPFGNLMGWIDLLKYIEHVLQAKVYAEYKDPVQVIGFQAGRLERGDGWGL